MAKEIILYNLAPHVTEEQYRDYIVNEKGPLLESLLSVEKFELVKITGSLKGQIPYQYVGILHIKDLDDFNMKDAPSEKFQNFLAKWKRWYHRTFIPCLERRFTNISVESP